MYSAKEVSEMTGLTTATLRYYEKEDLLPQISRTVQKYRQYSDEDIEWIKMIQCLRSANVPIHSIKQYVALLKQGGSTLEQRYDMVCDYIADIQNQLVCLKKALALTQEKSNFYEELLEKPSNKKLTYHEEWALYEKRRKT